MRGVRAACAAGTLELYKACEDLMAYVRTEKVIRRGQHGQATDDVCTRLLGMLINPVKHDELPVQHTKTCSVMQRSSCAGTDQVALHLRMEGRNLMVGMWNMMMTMMDKWQSARPVWLTVTNTKGGGQQRRKKQRVARVTGNIVHKHVNSVPQGGRVNPCLPLAGTAVRVLSLMPLRGDA